jgi:proline iminopeptidase
MSVLYPPIMPFTQESLEVGSGHRLYLEQSGRPDGFPVIFLHGGPGAGCEPYHRCFFDPQRYRIILFDQRGAGRSTPHADLTDNTTWDLVADMERIRQHLGIERWMLFGGSWGSTLALAYAQSHPERVAGLILRGIFLCRQEEIEWFYQEGASRIFPDYWQDYLNLIPEPERGDLLNAYHKRLTGDDEIQRMAAAKAWSIWEGRTSNLQPNDSVIGFFSNPHNALSIARIESHYFVNQSFLRPDQLLDEAAKLAGIPGVIVQGRYDLVCPMSSAWALHQAWPDSQLEVIPEAGHSAAEPGILSALVNAADRFAEQLS